MLPISAIMLAFSINRAPIFLGLKLVLSQQQQVNNGGTCHELSNRFDSTAATL